MKKVLSILLSVGLVLFLADAVVSLIDATLILLSGQHFFSVTAGLVGLVAVLMAILIYALMGLTPMVPKCLFLPITLFSPVATLVAVPFLIYHFDRNQELACVIALCQVILGLGILYCLQGGLKFPWPLVMEKHLGSRPFSWLNLSVFLLLNVLV